MIERLGPAGLSFHLSFQPSVLGPTGAHWLDDPSDLSCRESIRQHAVDDPLQSCKQGSSQLLGWVSLIPYEVTGVEAAPAS